MPIRATNVDSLTNFQKNAKAILAELEASGEPLVLTVNGKAEVVVQDAAAYQRMLDQLDRALRRQALVEAIREAEAGQTVTLEEAFASLRSIDAS